MVRSASLNDAHRAAMRISGRNYANGNARVSAAAVIHRGLTSTVGAGRTLILPGFRR